MKERPYHHLPDGTFRNPKGSPVIISRSGKFSYRTFSKLRKKVNLSYPKEHVIEKEKVLADLEKYKDNDYIAWIGHATYLIKLGGTTIITDPVFSKNAWPLIFGPNRFTDPAIKLNEISIYPEYNLLKNFLCDNYLDSRKFDNDEIGIFNGADAAINAIFNCFGEKDQIFLTTNPTFGY